MGAIAEAICSYAQPLLEQFNESPEAMNKALMVSTLCWNLALLPKDSQEASIAEMQTTLGMDDDDFKALRRIVIFPMIRRHEEMFPQMHQNRVSVQPQQEPWLSNYPKQAATTQKYPGTEPYAPCPCKSGRKYKFCCKMTSR